MATAYKCSVWCVMRGQLSGLLLLSIEGMLDTCSCLCMLATADSISGSGWWFPAWHFCGWGLLGLHNGCTEVTGSPIELL